MKIKNTGKESVVLSVDIGLSLAPNEIIEVDGKFVEDALKIEGIEEVKEKKAKKGKKK